jgi:hypothetical protein
MLQRLTCGSLMVAIAALEVLCASATAQQTAITTQLLGRVDSMRATEGGSFFVKTRTAWKQGQCSIPSGATLEGRIAKVQRKGSRGAKRDELQLRFLEIACSGDEAQQITPILVAMQSPHHDPGEDYVMQQELVGIFSHVRKAPASSSNTGGGAGGGGAPSSPIGGNAAGTAGNVGHYSPSASTEQPFHLAEVRGFPGVKLTPPVRTTDPTTLSSSSQILIDPDTRFRLVLELAPRPASSQAPDPARAAIGIPPAEPKPPPAQELVEIENCVETGCALADPSASAGDSPIERTVSLHAFGFKVRGNRVLRSLAEDAAVRFLGEDQLLITFNAHPLIVRSQDESARLANPRIIRALLFSITTGKIIRAEDWRVPDEGPYLWPLDGGRVLASVGGILAVYGPGLRVERQWSPLGDLRFLRVTPSRHLIVAVVAHERHTPEQHRRLAEFLGPERPVDEDFEFTLLDSQLNVQDNRRLENLPTLSEVLDTGLIVTEQGLQQRWTVSESDWDAKRHPITRVVSGCPLRVETLPANLILLVGCSQDQTSTWYKIVRSNGKTLLNGAVPSNGLLEQADAPTDAGVFAIGIAQALHPVDFDLGIVASDFQNVAVSVYRIADGRRLFATRSTSGAINRQSFALSQSGNQLAILSGDNVSLYRIGEQ